jgi:hypothetical protein
MGVGGANRPSAQAVLLRVRGRAIEILDLDTKTSSHVLMQGVYARETESSLSVLSRWLKSRSRLLCHTYPLRIERHGGSTGGKQHRALHACCAPHRPVRAC